MILILYWTYLLIRFAYHFILTYPRTMAKDKYFLFDDDDKVRHKYFSQSHKAELVSWNTKPYLLLKRWLRKWIYLRHTLDRIYLTSILFVQCFRIYRMMTMRYCNMQTHEYDFQALFIFHIFAGILYVNSEIYIESDIYSGKKYSLVE